MKAQLLGFSDIARLYRRKKSQNVLLLFPLPDPAGFSETKINRESLMWMPKPRHHCQIFTVQKVCSRLQVTYNLNLDPYYKLIEGNKTYNRCVWSQNCIYTSVWTCYGPNKISVATARADKR